LSRELQYDSQGLTGHTILGLIVNATLQAWNGSAWVELTASWSAGLVSMTEDGTTGVYYGDMPGGVDKTQNYTVFYFDAAVGDATISQAVGQQDYVPNVTVPSAADVLAGVTYGIAASLTGTLSLPAAGDVLAGTSYGVGGNASTGTLTLPSATLVLSGTSYGVAGDSLSGSLVLPPVADVVSGISYGVGGNGSTGTFVVSLPSAADVLAGVSVGAGTGTLVLPSPGEVLSGTVYGVGGDGSTGTRTDCPASSAVYGTSYGDPSSPTVGTFSNTLIQDQIEALLASYGIVAAPSVDLVPVAPNGDLSLVAGVDYCTALGNLLVFDAGDWPNLTGATVSLTLHPNSGGASDLGPIAGTVQSAGAGNQSVQFALTHAQTAGLSAAVQSGGHYTHTYTLEATWTVGGNQWAPPRGNASVYAM